MTALSVVDVDGIAALSEEGVVRLFVPPSMWIVDRELVVVAGSQTLRSMRDGVLSTNRVSATVSANDVAAGRVELPAFRLDEPALLEENGTLISVFDRDNALLAVHGARADGTLFRVIIGGNENESTIDLVRYGIDDVEEDSLRIWRIDTGVPAGTPTFSAGTLGIARAMAAPSSAVNLR